MWTNGVLIGIWVMSVLAAWFIGWAQGYWQGGKARAERIDQQVRLGLYPGQPSAAWHVDGIEPVVREVRDFPLDPQAT